MTMITLVTKTCVVLHCTYVQQAEEIALLQKRITQLNSDVGTAKVQLRRRTEKLENTNKQLANVSPVMKSFHSRIYWFVRCRISH